MGLPPEIASAAASNSRCTRQPVTSDQQSIHSCHTARHHRLTENPETILRQLREAGLCIFRPPLVEIVDLPGLARRGDFDPSYLYFDGPM